MFLDVVYVCVRFCVYEKQRNQVSFENISFKFLETP